MVDEKLNDVPLPDYPNCKFFICFSECKLYMHLYVCNMSRYLREVVYLEKTKRVPIQKMLHNYLQVIFNVTFWTRFLSVHS
jgi:hypothetical protein